MIEQAVYDVIKSVTPNTFPTQPDENVALPYLVYAVTSSEPQRTLQGAGSLVKHTVSVESYADTSADANALLAQVKAALDGYQGGNIHRALWSGQDTQPDDGCYHGTATYTVWMSAVNVAPQVGHNSVITTGQNFIELATCDRALRLDCDGLSLDGGPVGGSPDLSNCVTLDGTQTITGPKTFNADVDLNGNLDVDGETSVNTLNVGNNAHFYGTLTADTITLANYLDCQAGQVIANELFADTLQANAVVNGTTFTVNGQVVIDDGGPAGGGRLAVSGVAGEVATVQAGNGQGLFGVPGAGGLTGIACDGTDEHERLELRCNDATCLTVEPGRIGFFGTTPVAREAFTGDLDNEITQACAAIQDIRQKLINLGLVEDQRA